MSTLGVSSSTQSPRLSAPAAEENRPATSEKKCGMPHDDSSLPSSLLAEWDTEAFKRGTAVRSNRQLIMVSAAIIMGGCAVGIVGMAVASPVLMGVGVVALLGGANGALQTAATANKDLNDVPSGRQAYHNAIRFAEKYGSDF